MVVILQRETTHPRKPSRRFGKDFSKIFTPRIFGVARQQRAVPLYAEKLFGIRKVLALRGRVAFPSHATLQPTIWQVQKRGSDARQRQIPESTGIISNSPRRRISALSRCFIRRDRSITGAVLSSKESSPRSLSSSNATRRRRSLLPGWTSFIFNFRNWPITVRPSRRYNKYSDGKLLGKCSLKITYHQPTYLKGKPDRECSMSG